MGIMLGKGTAPRCTHRLNDIHSKLNPSWAREVFAPQTIDEVQRAIRHAADEDQTVSIAGARHAMGGQQFHAGGILLDMRALNRVVALDSACGIVEVEAGITWPQLIDYLIDRQGDEAGIWTIRQKQTGADHLTLGGAVAANVHGRGLNMQPLIQDVESLTLINAEGKLVTCSRSENAELFRLAVGGYGLVGVVVRVALRLVRRVKLERIVAVITVDDLLEAFESRIREGCLYGDFQYSTNEQSADYMRKGVLACYRRVDDRATTQAQHLALGEDDWQKLAYLAHVNKQQAYEHYVAHYRATHGQVYWSDTHQLSAYVNGYHDQVDGQVSAPHRGSEMISEIFVPRAALVRFMRSVAEEFRRHGVNLVYGTIRLIEAEHESVLAWARESWACVIFNLHVDHTPAGIMQTVDAFRRLIDLGIAYGGTYYLTYHRFATPEQLRTCYPQFQRFLGLKRAHDPTSRFRSDWFDQYGLSESNRSRGEVSQRNAEGDTQHVVQAIHI